MTQGEQREKVLVSERVQIERKAFVFSIRENARGRFLRIAEEVGSRRDMIIIPSSGLGAVLELIGRMILVADGGSAA